MNVHEEYYWSVVHEHGKNVVNNVGSGAKKRCEGENEASVDKSHKIFHLFLFIFIIDYYYKSIF